MLYYPGILGAAAQAAAVFSPNDLSPFIWWSIGTGDGDVDDSVVSNPQTDIKFADLGSPTNAWVVTQVHDMSGNGRHVSAGTAPNLLQNSLNMLPVVENIFGSGHVLGTGAITQLNQPFSFYGLLYTTSNAIRYLIGGATINNYSIGVDEESTPHLRSGVSGDFDESLATMSRGAWHKCAMLFDGAAGTTNKIRIDGTTGDFASAPHSTQHWGTTIYAGARGAGADFFWNGRWAELMLFSSELASADIDDLDQWILDTYGV